MKLNKTITEYFSNNPNNDPDLWHTDLNCYHISGFAILPDIVKLKPNKIIDIGCGYNEFKQYFPTQLIGVDITNTNADYVMDILDYPCEDNSVDVILALGSINFGSHELVEKQVEWISKKLRPGGHAFIRVNPAEAPDDSITEKFYTWKLEDIYDFSVKFNLEIYENTLKMEDRIPSPLIRGGSGFANVKLYWRYVKK